MQIKTIFDQNFFKEEDKIIKVGSDRKRLWAVLLDLLIEFDRVCRKNGIKYMIDGGTLLGAVRHGGFIPWDDDVDVVMSRSEYEKLNQIASREFVAPYFWQTNDTDPDYGKGFARLRNSSTTFVARSEMDNNRLLFHHNQGVPVDIFVCDNVPDGPKERTPFLKHLSRLQSLALNLRKQGRAPWRLGLLTRIPDLARKIGYIVSSFVLRQDVSHYLLKKTNAIAQRYNGLPTDCVSHLTFNADEGTRLCFIFPHEWIDELTQLEFEGYKFYAPAHWKEYLTKLYGNWHKHVVGVSEHGQVFVDLEKPYTEYLD